MNILVIGNGFDMDLGLKTSYGDFWRSKEFCKNLQPFTRIHNTLAEYMSEKAKMDPLWFNIEEAMIDYVKLKEQNHDFNQIDADKIFLDALKNTFWDFVSSKYLNADNRKCLSKEIIKIQKQFDKIYSFNCFETYYSDFASMGNIGSLNNVLCVHNFGINFILGIAEGDNIDERYSFLKKVNQNYPFDIVEQLKKDLAKADNIVIFGHSLNRIDMGYFEEMIRNLNERKTKRIVFVTKDMNTAAQIQSNIIKYGPLSLEELESSCNLSFVLTDKFIDSTIIEDIDDIFDSSVNLTPSSKNGKEN